MRATEDTSHDPFRLLEHRHGLAEIIERGAGVQVTGTQLLILIALIFAAAWFAGLLPDP